jgi:hypothetical protein
VGEEIRNVAIAGFQPPATIGDLADQVTATAPRVLRRSGVAVTMADDGGDGPAVRTAGVALEDAVVAKALWARSPWQVRYRLRGLDAVLDYGGEPLIEAGKPRRLELALTNTGPRAVRASVAWRPAGGLAARPASWRGQVGPGGRVVVATSLSAADPAGAVLRGAAEVTVSGRLEPLVVPFAVQGRAGVHAGDLALASRGAKATSDSELGREPGCTVRAVDGVVTGPNDFEGRRWHSALTPHPHWVAVELPRAEQVSRATIHFADPAGHPVDFDGEASLDAKEWTPLFAERGYGDARRYEKALPETTLRFFRLTIRRSASATYVDAAQVSEIELLP